MIPTITPSPEAFAALAAKGNILPIFADFISDSEPPVSAFSKLNDGGFVFLLESAVTEEKSGGRFTFVGFSPLSTFESRGRDIWIEDRNGKTHLEATSDPVAELERFMKRYQVAGSCADAVMPVPFGGGAVGFIGYDVVHYFEPTVPMQEHDALGLPETLFMVPEMLLSFDHFTRRARIICNVLVEPGDDLQARHAYGSARIVDVLRRLCAPSALVPLRTAANQDGPAPDCNMTPERYQEIVESGKEFIRAGDVFQFVPSQRFSTPYAGDALTLYRALRFVNPSPYMFLMQFGERFTLVGSSPEVHIRAINGRVEIRPIAGTRRRGKTKEEDEALAKELLEDPKERAEHLMLVDLARNDVGRISRYGTVQVTDSFIIEKYSHVMHIVSNVVGELQEGKTAYDAMRATFPAGTVSGSPKVRAMQIIGEFEGTRRGVYAGAVGYFGFDGNCDSCIALRTVVLKDGHAYVQAGAGIVADSVPESEHQECVNKAMGMMKAIRLAGQARITPSDLNLPSAAPASSLEPASSHAPRH